MFDGRVFARAVPGSGEQPTAPKFSRRSLLRYAAVAGAASVLPLTLPASSAAAAGGATKTRTTLYPQPRIDAAQANIRNFGWAQTIRDEVVGRAAAWLALTDDQVWSSVTSQSVPRSIEVNQGLGSPTSGRAIYDHGNYPWLFDPAKPWKVIDPVNGDVFPTNDFASFYTSGLNAQGLFDRNLANPKYLTNVLVKTQPTDWGVDDGSGWVDKDLHRWTFVAYYNAWYVWFGGQPWIPQTKGLIFNGIKDLRDAYLYTGDPRYAHAGLILLDRVADVYPSMDIYPYWSTTVNNQPGNGKGKILGSIDETELIREFVSSYDAFFPAIETADTANVVPFLAAKARAGGLPAKDSIDAVKRNIEDNLVRQVYPAVHNGQIVGNFGMHQSTLATAAVVLDSAVPSETAAWIDFIFKTGGWAADGTITGGNIDSTLIDTVDRDGFGNEASPDYNLGWVGDLLMIADLLATYDRHPVDLFANVKFRKVLQAMYSLTMLNQFVTVAGQPTSELKQYTPSIGDSGGPGRPRTLVKPEMCVRAFEKFGLPEHAQMAVVLNGNSVAGLNSSIFAIDAAATQQRIQAIIDQQGPMNLKSGHLTGYGFAALRTGSGAASRGLWLYHGRSGNIHPDTPYHAHADSLNLGLYGFGVDLLPDLGYPEFNGYYAFRWEWNNNTISHNTVMVDEQTQSAHWDGTPVGFAAGDRVRYVEVSSPEVYSPTTTVYRRADLLVDIDDTNSYVLDVFRVVGGGKHHFSFHAAEGPVVTEGLNLVRQDSGTYAGPTIDQPHRDLTLDPNQPQTWDFSGFRWLNNVSRQSGPVGGFSADWAVQDTFHVHDPIPDLHLRWTMLSTVDGVALCDGPVSANTGNPKSLRYAVVNREGTNLESAFVSVIEPYVGQRQVTQARLVPVRAAGTGTFKAYEVVAVRVELRDGRVDYLVHTTRPDLPLVVDEKFTFQGTLGFLSLRNDLPEHAFGHQAADVAGLEPLRGAAAIAGQVSDFTMESSASNQITLQTPTAGIDPAALPGSLLYADSQTYRNAAYPIRGASVLSSRSLRLDIGDLSPIRGFVDPNDTAQGFLYDIGAGAGASIPLIRSQSTGFGAAGVWLLDDARGQTASDSSGNNRAATVVGAAGTGLGAPGRIVGRTALSCDGQTTEASTPGPVLATDHSFTVSAWARLGATGDYRVVASQDGTTRSAFVLQYDPGADRWTFGLPAADTGSATFQKASSSAPPILGVWTHLAGVFDAGLRQLRIYVNGRLDGTAGGVTAWNGTGRFRIGRSLTGFRFSGTLAEVRAAARVLADWEISDLARTRIGRWALDGTGQDGSGFGRPLTATATGVSWVADRAGTGVAQGLDGTGGALGLDGTGWLGTPAAALYTEQSFTVAAWVRKVGPNDGSRVIASQAGNVQAAFYLLYDGNHDRWGAALASVDAQTVTWSSVNSTSQVTPGVWTHLAVVHDRAGGLLRLHVNGVLEGTLTGVSLWPSTGLFRVGANNDGQARWIGDIDEVHAYAGALSTGEIGRLFRS
jgi:oligo-alginate lyase